MTFRLISIAVVLVIAASRGSDAQEILFSNNAAYLNQTTPRVALNGYLNTIVQNGTTYQHVGIVLSNSYSTYNDIANPAANTPGTTFGYAANAPFGALPTSLTWQVDLPLPVQKISTDPSNPTYITVSFYLVSNNGVPYNNEPFSTYCFMTYISAGKVLTSPAGGPYFAVLPPVAIGENKAKDSLVSAKTKAKTRRLPPPTIQNTNLNGFWDIRPSPLHLQAMNRATQACPTTVELAPVVG
jgi:hypothetical protein